MSSHEQIRRLNIPDQVLYATVFLILFVVGIMGGRSIGMLTISSNNLQSHILDDNPAIINNGQQNLVIITIDQLASANPKINSIWLLITFPEFYNLALVPVYPSSHENPAVSNLVQVFALTENQTLDPEFSNLLHEQFYWDYYLIVDKIGASSIMRIYDQFVSGTPIEIDRTPTILLPQTGQEMELSFNDELQIWDGVCSKLSQISKTEELNYLFKLVSHYFRTDLRWETFSHQWSFDPSKGNRINCEFPTLTLNNP